MSYNRPYQPNLKNTSDLINQTYGKLAGAISGAGGADVSQAFIEAGFMPELAISYARKVFLSSLALLRKETLRSFLGGKMLSKDYSITSYREVKTGDREVEVFKRNDNIEKHLRNIEAATLRGENAVVFNTIALTYHEGDDALDFDFMDFPVQQLAAGQIEILVNDKQKAIVPLSDVWKPHEDFVFNPRNPRIYLSNAVVINKDDIVECNVTFEKGLPNPSNAGKNMYIKCALEGTALRML